MWTGLFLLGGAFILYVLFGYPALLAVLASHRAKPIRRRSMRPTVSILLPVRNGEAWIRQKLESILKLDYPRELVEILVISNGSTDATEAIVEEFGSRGVELIRLAQAGKAEAINEGMKHYTPAVMALIRQQATEDAVEDLEGGEEEPEDFRRT